MLRTLAEEGFVGFCADEAETARVIRNVWTEHGYAADPHTAVGIAAVNAHRAHTGDRGVIVTLSTASPFKFAAPMLSSLGKSVTGDGFADLRALSAGLGIPAPAPLAGLEDKTVLFPGVVKQESMASAVLDWLVK